MTSKHAIQLCLLAHRALVPVDGVLMNPTELSCAWCDRGDTLDLAQKERRRRVRLDYGLGWGYETYTNGPDLDEVEAWLASHASCEEEAQKRHRSGWKD